MRNVQMGPLYQTHISYLAPELAIPDLKLTTQPIFNESRTILIDQPVLVNAGFRLWVKWGQLTVWNLRKTPNGYKEPTLEVSSGNAGQKMCEYCDPQKYLETYAIL